MSLLTDALRLKEGRLTRKNDYPSMPPLGRPSAWRWILIVAVGCVFAVWLILHWEEVYVKVEELAGIKSLKPGSALAGKVLDGREAEANTKPAVSPPAQAVVAEPKSDKKTEAVAKVEVAEAAVTPAPDVEEDEVSQVEMRKDEGEPVQAKSALTRNRIAASIITPRRPMMSAMRPAPNAPMDDPTRIAPTLMPMPSLPRSKALSSPFCVPLMTPLS